MSKRLTKSHLAEAAQVCESEVRHLAKFLATEVLGIHPAEWVRLTRRFAQTQRHR